jgi:hypothetical protein
MKPKLLSLLILALIALLGSAVTISATPAETTYPFEFHSGFWINLHHFLYEQALLKKESKPLAAPKTPFSPAQQQVWNAAIDYYTSAVIKGDLLTDRATVIANDELGDEENAPDLNKAKINPELRKTLESVAPIYRTEWWPVHDRNNRFWIAVATPMVQQFARTFIDQVSTAFRSKWPAGLIRVDVVEYADWAGAYTTIDPAFKVHTTLCSIESAYQSYAALEMLFHEASHSMVGPYNGPVAQAIAREARAKNKPIPGGLWHAIIFYTTGEITKRNLIEYGIKDYVPVGYRGLYARAWPKFLRPLELYWQPYLDGKTDFDTAMVNLINAL